MPYPLLLPALFLCLGIGLGHVLPWNGYLLVALVVWGMGCLHRREGRTSSWFTDALLLLFWIPLGAGRICLDHPSVLDFLPFVNPLDGMRDSLLGWLNAAPIDKLSKELLAALLFGDKSLLEWGLRDAFRQIGASHLLALSGLHLGILYGLLRLCGLRNSWVLMAIVWIYTALVGAPPSLVRAALVLSLYHLLSRRQPGTHPIQLLCVASMITLLISPASLFDVGFQLSYMACVGIGFLSQLWKRYTIRRKHASRRRKALLTIVTLLAVSLAAQLGTLPLVAYYFHQIPLLGWLYGLILIPLTTLVVYGGVGLLALTGLSHLFIILGIDILTLPLHLYGTLLDSITGTQIWLVEHFSQFPCGMLSPLMPPLWSVLLLYLLLLLEGVLWTKNSP